MLRRLIPLLILCTISVSAMAAPPEEARRLFTYLVERAQAIHEPVAAGVFGADMQVSLVNDGPVTFWLETPVTNVHN